MESSPPFPGPYANGLPPWHHSGHLLDRPFTNDSGYASEDSDSDSAPFFLSPDPDHQRDELYTNQVVNHDAPPCMQQHHHHHHHHHHRAKAAAATFVSAATAQLSHPPVPVAFKRACWPPAAAPFHHDSCSDSDNDSSRRRRRRRRSYDLPPSLPFEEEEEEEEEEEQPKDYVSGSSPLKRTTSCNRRGGGGMFDYGKTFSHTVASRWDLLEEETPPLDVEGHRARVPDALASLGNNRIRSESEHFPPPPPENTLRHGSSSPNVKFEDPKSLGSITPAQPDNWNGNGNGNGNSMPSPARPRLQCQNQSSSSHDAQLAAAWRALYQERRELEKDRRVLRMKERKDS